MDLLTIPSGWLGCIDFRINSFPDQHSCYGIVCEGTTECLPPYFICDQMDHCYKSEDEDPNLPFLSCNEQNGMYILY